MEVETNNKIFFVKIPWMSRKWNSKLCLLRSASIDNWYTKADAKVVMQSYGVFSQSNELEWKVWTNRNAHRHSVSRQNLHLWFSLIPTKWLVWRKIRRHLKNSSGCSALDSATGTPDQNTVLSKSFEFENPELKVVINSQCRITKTKNLQDEAFVSACLCYNCCKPAAGYGWQKEEKVKSGTKWFENVW